MTAPQANVLRNRERERSNWIRLRTLVLLRWIAIAGQIIALIVAAEIFDLRVQSGLAAMAIGASIIANLFSTVLFPESRRLSEFEATLMLLFDLLQLALLLFMTGGLNNPFALLILVPVTIASTFLRLPSTMVLGAVAIAITTALVLWHMPLVTTDGIRLAMPPIFVFGFWAALTIGVVFLGVYARQVTGEMHKMSDALLATQMALAREQKLTDLGGVVAAAAHELGTPLATIKLVSGELLDEVQDKPDVYEDILLIRQQADRCRDILRSMGRAGKDDLHMHRAPLEAVVREAAEPHMGRGKTISFTIDADAQPDIERRPEIIHGLRNLIQNAVDFAATRVDIECLWTADRVTLRIADDGRGFPTGMLGRIGDPFLRQRREDEEPPGDDDRPGYEGMGLGLFIAKTLLERSGARLTFTNGGAKVLGQGDGGAIVLVEWNRVAVSPPAPKALGENRQFGA